MDSPEAYFNSWQSAHAAITEKDVMKRALRWSEWEEDGDG